MGILENLTSWHWVIIGILFLAADILGLPGLLIGLAMAAFIVAGLVFSDVLQHWQSMLVTFALLGIVLTLAYTRFFKRYNDKTDAPDLNNFCAQMIGTEFTATRDYTSGKHRIKIHDTVWECLLEDAVKENNTLQVTDYRDNTLIIKAKP